MTCNCNNLSNNLESLLLPTCPTTFMIADSTVINFIALLCMTFLISFLVFSFLDFVADFKVMKGDDDQQEKLDNSNIKLTDQVYTQITQSNIIQLNYYELEDFITKTQTIYEDDEDCSSLPYKPIEPVHFEQVKIQKKELDNFANTRIKTQNNQEWFFRPDLSETELKLLSFSEKARRFYYLTNNQKFKVESESSTRQLLVSEPITQASSLWTGSNYEFKWTFNQKSYMIILNPKLMKCLKGFISQSTDHQKVQMMTGIELMFQNNKALVDLNLKPHEKAQKIKLLTEPYINNQMISFYNNLYNQVNLIKMEPEPPEGLMKYSLNALKGLFIKCQVSLLHLNHQLTSSYLKQLCRPSDKSGLELKSDYQDICNLKPITGQYKFSSILHQVRRMNHFYPLSKEIGLAQLISFGSDNLMSYRIIPGRRR